MTEPLAQGAKLLADIAQAPADTPSLWWLGHCGFVLKYRGMILYIDPYLSDSQAERYRRTDHPHERLMRAPLHPATIRDANLVLCTHAHGAHLDRGTLPYLLEGSSRARLVLPRSAAGRANSFGVDYLRMTTTDVGIPVEFSKDGEQVHIDAIPSAHEQLDWSQELGHPYLGYLIHCGEFIIYHAGDCVPYDGLAERLRANRVTVAILPINGRDPSRGMPGNFSIAEAADLAAASGVQWLVPMHYGMFALNDVPIDSFVSHMLGHRPEQRFKIFQCGERWDVPQD
jgi:L-ascorbate metabolism protein UlaG (beta-lactamase superfamily)